MLLFRVSIIKPKATSHHCLMSEASLNALKEHCINDGWILKSDLINVGCGRDGVLNKGRNRIEFSPFHTETFKEIKEYV